MQRVSFHEVCGRRHPAAHDDHLRGNVRVLTFHFYVCPPSAFAGPSYFSSPSGTVDEHVGRERGQTGVRRQVHQIVINRVVDVLSTDHRHGHAA